MKYDIIIAHHNESTYRERNLNTMLSYYLDILPSDSRVIIVEQNTKTSLSVSDSRITHIFESYDTEYFWKSKLLNKGISESTAESYCIVDSDAIISKAAIDYISECDVNNVSVFFPYNSVKMMNEGETRRWIRNGSVPNRVDTKYQKFNACYTGFFMVISKHNYDLIGGFDEEYIGWGGEDDAILIKTIRLSKLNDQIDFPSTVMHLYHPKKDTAEYIKSTRHNMNSFYTHALKTMPINQLNDYISQKYDGILTKYVSDNNITEDSLTYRLDFKSGNHTLIALTGAHIMPNENAEFTLDIIFDSLYRLLGKVLFIQNTQITINESTDDEERDKFRSIINRTLTKYSKYET